jgi:hypothetical protein
MEPLVREPSDVNNTLELLAGILDELKNIKIHLAKQDERIRGLSRSSDLNIYEKEPICELVCYETTEIEYHCFNHLLKRSENKRD